MEKSIDECNDRTQIDETHTQFPQSHNVRSSASPASGAEIAMKNEKSSPRTFLLIRSSKLHMLQSLGTSFEASTATNILVDPCFRLLFNLFVVGVHPWVLCKERYKHVGEKDWDSDLGSILLVLWCILVREMHIRDRLAVNCGRRRHGCVKDRGRYFERTRDTVVGKYLFGQLAFRTSLLFAPLVGYICKMRSRTRLSLPRSPRNQCITSDIC